MLRAVTFCMLLTVLPGRAQPGFEVEVVANPVHQVFYSLECLRGEPHHNPYLARLHRERRGNLAPLEQAVEAYQNWLDQSPWNTLRLPGCGLQQRDLPDALEILAVQAHDIDDFVWRSQALLGVDGPSRLRTVE